MENELKTQAVKLSQNEQYQIRKNIVRLLKKGKSMILSIILETIFSNKYQATSRDFS